MAVIIVTLWLAILTGVVIWLLFRPQPTPIAPTADPLEALRGWLALLVALGSVGISIWTRWSTKRQTEAIFRRGHYSDIQATLGWDTKYDRLGSRYRPALRIRNMGENSVLHVMCAIEFRPMAWWRRLHRRLITETFEAKDLEAAKTLHHVFGDMSITGIFGGLGLGRMFNHQFGSVALDKGWLGRLDTEPLSRKFAEILLHRLSSMIGDMRFRYEMAEKKLPWAVRLLSNLDLQYRIYRNNYQPAQGQVEVEAITMVSWKVTLAEGEYILKRSHYILRPECKLTVAFAFQGFVERGSMSETEAPKEVLLREGDLCGLPVVPSYTTTVNWVPPFSEEIRYSRSPFGAPYFSSTGESSNQP